MKFRNRSVAGQQLAAALRPQLKGHGDVLILALPRGGVPVAAEVALALNAPMDVFFSHKIGAPDNPELAIAAVAETGPPFIEESVIHSLRIPFSYVRQEAAYQQKEMARQAELYRSGNPAIPIETRWVVLIDDGVATGSTAHAALQSIRNRIPARLIFATPVAAADTVRRLAMDADDLVILQAPTAFFAVGEFYEEFLQVPDSEVISLMTAARGH
jgi:putative phosphoribosyl transferase